VTAGLLRDLRIDHPPVDLNRIAKHLGVRVQRTDLGAECSGALVRTADGAVIGVHWAHHPNRQRFSLAHELGHFCLHQGGTYIDKDVTVRFRDEESGSGTNVEERQANQFAAALLMPTPWVRRAFQASPFAFGDDSALSQLAEAFQVSTQAMSIRLADLGLLKL
jgi:Zn-dependent peptidase ImmA (M78 family)